MEFVGLLLQAAHLPRLYGEITTEFCDLPFHALWPIDRWVSFTFPHPEGMRIQAGRQLRSHEHLARITQRALWIVSDSVWSGARQKIAATIGGTIATHTTAIHQGADVTLSAIAERQMTTAQVTKSKVLVFFDHMIRV